MSHIHKEYYHEPDGRILYVSINGDDTIAEVGNTEKAWRTPQSARDASSSGDLIFVFPGTYTYGNAGSGADYEGLGTGSGEAVDQEVALNYGVTDLNYYFEPGTTLQGIGTTPRAILYEPWGVTTETPSTINVYGHLNVNTTGAGLQMIYKDSEWYVEFHDMTCGTDGIRTDANYTSVGGLTDLVHIKKLVVRGHSVTATADGLRLSGASGTTVSPGRDGISRGLVDINVDHLVSGNFWVCSGFINYDIFIKHKTVKHDFSFWGPLCANTNIHIDADDVELTTDTGQVPLELNSCENLKGFVNIRRLSHSNASCYAGVLLQNSRGTPAQWYIHIDEAVTNSDTGCISIRHTGLDGTASFQGYGFTGQSVYRISGNFFESNATTAVVDHSTSPPAKGATDRMLVNLKNCHLVHTNSGDSISSPANTEFVISGCYSNVNTDTGTTITEIGESIVVNSDYTT